MDSSNRLLFAAARGARIDIQGKDGNWYKASAAPVENKAGVQFRTHPDDEHLQYGPISTALRKRAETGEVEKAGLPYLVGNLHFDGTTEWVGFVNCDESTCSLFLLILAEALADEGL